MDFEKEIINIINKLNKIEKVVEELSNIEDKHSRAIEIIKTDIKILKEGDNL